MGADGDRSDADEWVLSCLLGGRATAAELEERLAAALFQTASAEDLLSRIGAWLSQVAPFEMLEGDLGRVTILGADGHRWSVTWEIDRGTGLVSSIRPERQPDIADVQIESWECRSLARDHLQFLASVFNAGYRNGDIAYLDEQVARHDYVIVATCGPEPAGFMFGTFRFRELPGFGETFLTIGGLGCVAPAFQRRGLFSAMRNCPDVARFVPPGPFPSSIVTAGRFAHPASFRPFASSPGVVPVPGQTPSPLQQEVGRAVAAEMGVVGFDPRTFVCAGHGASVGDPVIEIDVSLAEWEVFRGVERRRGDTLLGLTPASTPPVGWDP